ncbi:lysis system i-spanin subunit Rz [Pseudomonas vancouverensis]|uniref:Lysis protein n=1 Tax=Pseudomonas vancouverensis TaxID=95300 RepID=A0A1H2MYM9_PSEVA|nr:lysis system i-spanin subunit Rz [Pseudomonas vancouverensis]KAB0489631.1 lysis protein [Pseudomonas vancouverensis]TDB69277.1 lysis protein [Pseudomonas vancouverensis]SDU97596.1 Bacteriophage Rz lysis protein [Pseudomonas vancouverensis]
MNPATLKFVLIGVLVLLLITTGATWKVQDWRYGKQLAEQSDLHKDDLSMISNAAAAKVRADQDKRLVLEQRLEAIDQTHYKELSDAQTKQDHVRDRLATAELRLSVLLDAADSASGYSVPAYTGAGGMVHGGTRARLDPAHAQRIVSITDEGDRGLIALRACQDYVRNIRSTN